MLTTLGDLLDHNPQLNTVKINEEGTKRFQERRLMPVVEGDTFSVVEQFVRDGERIIVLAWNEWNYIEVRANRPYWIDPGQKERR